MLWRKRRAAFALEAAVALTLLLAAAGTVTHFAVTNARNRTQAWSTFGRQMQLENLAIRLQHVDDGGWQETVERLRDDPQDGGPRIDTREIALRGVAGQHVVITLPPSDADPRSRRLAFWRFAQPDAGEDANAPAADETSSDETLPGDDEGSRDDESPGDDAEQETATSDAGVS